MFALRRRSPLPRSLLAEAQKMTSLNAKEELLNVGNPRPFGYF
jgi:hypothetical protein